METLIKRFWGLEELIFLRAYFLCMFNHLCHRVRRGPRQMAFGSDCKQTNKQKKMLGDAPTLSATIYEFKAI